MRRVWLAALGVVSLAAVPRGGAQFFTTTPVLRPMPSGAATIVGVVLSDAGAPAGGATVSIKVQSGQPPDYDAPMYQPRKTTADGSGRFTFSDVPDNAVELTAAMPGFLETIYGQARAGLPGTPIRLSANQRLSDPDRAAGCERPLPSARLARG